MRILIIRHGDPDYTIDSLTPSGHVEARELAKRLEKLEVKAFYCSPLGRARATAAPTLEAKGVQAEIKPWLREFGHPVDRPDGNSGVPWDWLPEDWTVCPEFYDKDRWTDHPVFQKAGIREAADEVIQGLDEILSHHGYVRQGNGYRAEQANEDTIVFFCHLGVGCLMLSHLLGVSPMVLWHNGCMLPSSVTTLVTEERRKGFALFRMNGFSDVSHLYAASLEPSFQARFCEVYENMSQRH